MLCECFVNASRFRAFSNVHFGWPPKGNTVIPWRALEKQFGECSVNALRMLRGFGPFQICILGGL